MIDLLQKWNLNDNKYSFYDIESLTLTEMSGKLHGKINEVIEDYNKFVENTNKIINDFQTGIIESHEIYETAMRQEFQDFIDVIDLKVQHQDGIIDEIIESIDERINELNNSIDEAYEYMKNHLMENALKIIEDALAKNGIAMSSVYDETTETLTLGYTNPA